jgi:hypothetical protein
MRSCSSGGIPAPVSLTSMMARAPRRRARTQTRLRPAAPGSMAGA